MEDEVNGQTAKRKWGRPEGYLKAIEREVSEKVGFEDKNKGRWYTPMAGSDARKTKKCENSLNLMSESLSNLHSRSPRS